MPGTDRQPSNVAAWKALLAQLAGWAAAALLLLPFPGLADAPLRLALAQGVSAALASRLLKAAQWWLPIHILFTPALVVAGRLDLSPWLYLAAYQQQLPGARGGTRARGAGCRGGTNGALLLPHRPDSTMELPGKGAAFQAIGAGPRPR
ncbi:MAG: hypothetical protein AB1768_03815 [Pseudomonadota bacterium]|jgi:hypothetical protein